MELDYSDSINITITKVKFGGEFSHWSVDVESDTKSIGLAGTAPTIWGVLDMATDYLWEQGQEEEWFKANANKEV